MKQLMKRWLKIILGLIITVIGLILMPIPGPGGTPVTLAGLAILSSELPIAKRLRDKFLHWKEIHFKKASPAKRFALVSGTLVGYIMMTTGLWWLWSART